MPKCPAGRQIGVYATLIFLKECLRGLNYFHVFVFFVKIILSLGRKIKSVPCAFIFAFQLQTLGTSNFRHSNYLHMLCSQLLQGIGGKAVIAHIEILKRHLSPGSFPVAAG